MRFHHAVRTDVGRVREHNEDSFLADPDLQLYVVADGMGGRAAGEVASRLAVQTVHDVVGHGVLALDAAAKTNGHDRADAAGLLLSEAIAAAAQAVFEASQAEPDRKGMGTTLTAVLFFGREAWVAHVGDSRAYLVRGGRASQLTRDHSLIDELVVAGHITREEAGAPEMDRLRCVLARAVGVSSEVDVDVIRFDPLPGDRLVLCTDGLSHYFAEPEIAAVAVADGLESAAARFVTDACDRGGHDNVTALVVGCDSDDPADQDRLRTFDRLADALAQVPLFDRLDPRELLHVALAAETFDADVGDVILHADRPAPALFVVLDGRVQLTRNGAAPEDAGPGRWFGDSALVDRWVGAPTVRALEATRLGRLTRDALVAVSRREPEIAPKIVYAFAQAATARARAAAAQG